MDKIVISKATKNNRRTIKKWLNTFLDLWNSNKGPKNHNQNKELNGKAMVYHEKSHKRDVCSTYFN